MQLVERSDHLKPRHRVIYTLFALLFLISAFYYQDNLGGEGLSLPFNAVVWIPAVLIMSGGLLSMLCSGLWVKPKYFALLLAFPIGLLVSGFLSGMERPSEWIIRLGVITGGMLFWFSLLQFRLIRRDLENLLYLLLASILLHAMVGLIQIAPEPILRGWIPISPDKRLLGIFQQANLQASMMATGIVLSIYLASLPSFSKQRWPMKTLVFLSLALCTLEVVGAGSRVGMLGAGVGLLFIFASRVSLFLNRKITLGFLVVSLIIGSGLGFTVSDGALRAYSKIEQLAEEGKDARPHIYRIAVDTFERSPFLGHGIGSFQREFQNQRADYYDPARGEVIDNARFSHPHNELLFWMIEGGLVALIALMMGALAVLLQLIKLGWQRGGAMAGLLFPIALHTQVELPFYISTLHWLVLLVLLAVCFTPLSQRKNVGLSVSAGRLLIGVSVLSVPLVTLFLQHSLLAQTGIMQYLKTRGTQPVHLNVALNNLYFRETGEYFTMRSILYSQIQQKQHQHTSAFINWAEQFLSQIPDIQVFRDLAVAYEYEGRADDAKRLIERARAIYPEEASLMATQEKIDSGTTLIPTFRSVPSLPASTVNS